GEWGWVVRGSGSWSAWPRSARPCPAMWAAVSGVSVPEKTRTSETRPTYGSIVVLTTSATSGPFGSHDSGSAGEPSRFVTAGSSCSAGGGDPAGGTPRRGSRPRLLGAHTRPNGENAPVGHALSRGPGIVSARIPCP